MRKVKKNNAHNNEKFIFLIISFFVIVFSLIGILINLKNILHDSSYLAKENRLLHQTFSSLFKENYSKLEFPLLAVDDIGNGVVTKLIIEIKNGTGKVLVNIENLLFWIDTQHSIRIAKNLAEKLSKINTSNLDIIYTIEVNASIIGGPSAGSAIAIATFLALTKKEYNKDVVITGTIDEIGNIGRVGKIKEKCLAAKNYGAKICLIPKGQITEYELIPKRECKKFGNFEFCRITYEIKEVDLSKEIGIKIVEVSNIQEALEYFI